MPFQRSLRTDTNCRWCQGGAVRYRCRGRAGLSQGSSTAGLRSVNHEVRQIPKPAAGKHGPLLPLPLILGENGVKSRSGDRLDIVEEPAAGPQPVQGLRGEASASANLAFM